MEGLAKLAWTKKRLDQANKTYDEMINTHIPLERMSDDEIQSILSHVKNKDNIAPQFVSGPDNGLAFQTDRKNAMKAKKMYDQKKKIDEYAYLIGKHYSGAKDGIIVSPKLRSSFTHEVGHAVDSARNPLLYKTISKGKLFQRASSPAALLNGATISYLASDMNEENDMSKNMLEGFTSGALSGGAMGGLGSLLVNRGENVANKYGREIVSEINNPEKARKLLAVSQPLRQAAKKTYNINAQRILKNNLINAGLGAIVGGSLASIAHMHKQDYDS